MAELANATVVFGEADERTRAQLDRCVGAEGGARGVLCADNHLGYSMPIGGVVAYRQHVSPSGVGFDIACGNCAMRVAGVKAADVDIARVMDEIWKVISFGVGRSNAERIDDHPIAQRIVESPVMEQRALLQMAMSQLGTVGSGNHYVDLFEDRADGALWIGVHFGSRGFGHKTASGFLALAENKTWGERTADDMDAPPTLLSIDAPLGQDYLAAMEIAGDYAYAGREWVCERVLTILGAKADKVVHNHHNFAWHEEHAGEPWIVVRKGATPAWPGQQGFIGGSMGEDAVIVEGLASQRSGDALFSTVHGAGRVISRRKAKGKTKITAKWVCRNYRACDYKGAKGGFHKDPGGPTPTCPNCGHKLDLKPCEEQLSVGLVDWQAAQQSLQAQGIEVRGGGADEAPECYKRLPEVLAAHAGTIKVLHQLRIRGVAMAGMDTVDPYKD